MLRPRLTLALVPILPFLLASPLRAHDDDPKVLDVQPIYGGPGWRPGAPLGSGEDGDFYLSGGGEPPIEFENDGVELLSWLAPVELGGGGGNDCWGYTSPTGREYAIMGTVISTVFVEITNPSFPDVVAIMPGATSLWRDIKTYQHYAYSVNESADGIQVFDLDQIDQGVVTELANVTTGGIESSHNVAIDEVSGFLYRCGGSGNGLRVYSLANPASPTFVASWSDRYVHDAQVVTYTDGPYAGKQIAFICGGYGNGSTQTRFEILDVTNKSNIFTRDTVFYSNRAYAHQVWLSEDRQHAFLNDELDEGGSATTRTIVMDVSNLDAAFEATTFTNGNRAIGHNLYTRGDLVFEANYRSGMRVFDVSDPLNAQEVASFDTWANNDFPAFNGLWSCYPFFPSGTVIGSDREKGLFIWWVGEPLVSVSYPAGIPEVVDTSGDTVVVEIDELNAGDLLAGSPELHYHLGGGMIDVPLVPLGGNQYRADLPAADCGVEISWHITARSTNGIEWRSPAGAPRDSHRSYAGFGQTVVFHDDMESDLGWVLGLAEDTATAGVWSRIDPNGSEGQSANDHSENGVLCMVTGQFQDVDGGKTSLMSPKLALAGLSDPVVDYWRWYANSLGLIVSLDKFRVLVSNDDGNTWVLVELLGPHGPEVSGGWFHRSFHVRDFVDLTDDVRVKFVVSDTATDNLVEAAIDEFRVVDRLCDCDGNGVADGQDISSGASEDCNANGIPDGCDIASGTSLDGDGDGVPDECSCLAVTYCVTSPNSIGAGALIGSQGSTSLSAADLTLTVSGAAQGQFGLFFYGPDETQVTFGDGVLCVDAGAAGIFRFDPPVTTDLAGATSHAIDFAALPVSSGAGMISAGSTWRFQFWYRDPLGGPAGFNLSNGLRAGFCP